MKKIFDDPAVKLWEVGNDDGCITLRPNDWTGQSTAIRYAIENAARKLGISDTYSKFTGVHNLPGIDVHAAKTLRDLVLAELRDKENQRLSVIAALEGIDRAQQALSDVRSALMGD